MPAKKIFAALFIIVVAVGGFVAGLYLLRQRQNASLPAAVPTGDAKVYISPEANQVAIGETFDSTISFNTQGIPISGIAIQLVYPFSGTSPEVTMQGISISSGLTSSDWTCPTQNSRTESGNVIVEIGCANTSSSGFVSTQNTDLATVTFKAERQPITSPVTMRFDPANSVITRKSDNQDILLIPESVGAYTVGEASQVTVTLTPTARPTGVTRAVSPTTGAVSSGTPTPTALPDTGAITPTLVGAIFGGLVIIGALVLAI